MKSKDLATLLIAVAPVLIILNCQNVGTFSYDACPYSDNGGCRSNTGTVSEIISWSYSYGGQPITGDVLTAQIATCNSVEVSEWIMVD